MTCAISASLGGSLQSALFDSFRAVESQQPSRSLSDDCNAQNLNAGENEVFIPALCARVEQGDQIPAHVECGDIASLVSVTEDAGVGQIGVDGLPAVFFGYHMIDLAAEEGVVLVDQTIFTTTLGTTGHQTAEFCGNVTLTHSPRPSEHVLWPIASNAPVEGSHSTRRFPRAANRSFSHVGLVLQHAPLFQPKRGTEPRSAASFPQR